MFKLDDDNINDVIASVDVERLRTSRKNDRIRILEAVRCSSGGTEAVNQKVLEKRRMLLTTIALEILKANINDSSTYLLMINTTKFLKDQGTVINIRIYLSFEVNCIIFHYHFLSSFYLYFPHYFCRQFH